MATSLAAMHPPSHPIAHPPRLAAAFLALSDVEPGPDSHRRTGPLAAVAALAAAVVLACSAPLAWVSRPVPGPSDLPAATQASKATILPGSDDDGAGAG
jgi:hypothetical protein